MLLESEPIVLITDHRQNLDINADNWIQFFNETLYKRKILNDILIICGKENIYYQAYSVSALGTQEHIKGFGGSLSTAQHF